MEKGCNGRCEACNVNQRTYCAAQMAYYAQQEISEIKALLTKPKDEQPIIVISEPNAPGAEIETEE